METIDKYNKLILSKLPEEITKELDEIKSSTNNFQDEEILAVFQENFNDLYSIIEKKYPDAIKPKMKLAAVTDKPKRKLQVPEKFKTDTTGKGGKLKQQVGELVKQASLPAVVGDPDDCEEAIEELHEIKVKKEKAAEKRAKTIKKKTRSERIKERIGNVFISIKKADKENKYTEQIDKLEKFHISTTAHLLRFIRNNDNSGIEKLLKLAMAESKI